MSTATKARKASGVKFVHPAQVGTPFQDRHVNPSKYFFQWHPKQKNQQYGVSRRAEKKFSDQAEFLAAYSIMDSLEESLPKHRKK